MSVTVDDVVAALDARAGEWHLAGELPVKGSIQGIGNALRHAWHRRLIERRYVDHGRNISQWRRPTP